MYYCIIKIYHDESINIMSSVILISIIKNYYEMERYYEKGSI